MKSRTQRILFWAIMLFSLTSLFFSPIAPIISDLKKNIPWVASGILLSEVILTAGFLIMLSIATPAFIRSLKKSVGGAVRGILGIKETILNLDWVHVANKCNSSKPFWLGFWVSVIGACGDGVVLILAIGKTLPLSSWGLMLIPFWDLGLTFFVRQAIYKGVKKHEGALA